VIARPFRVLLSGALVLAGSLPGLSLADVLVGAHQEHTGHVMSPAAATEAPAAPTLVGLAPKPTAAVVRKIDKATGKITLKHGPIANLGMPP
jgi:Cu/Ag efflux protein CusF